MGVKKFVDFCESIPRIIGKLASWLIFFLILILVYEVICRHVFNRPTFWAYDISYMLGGTAAFLGIAWVQQEGKHVRVDIFYEKLSPKYQAILDIILALLLFFPIVIIGLVKSIDVSVLSWIRHESAPGAWRPAIYPLKTIIPIAFGILLLQAIAELIKNFYKLMGRKL